MPDVDAFTGHREHLLGVAYRMLGIRGEAEDAVQETWLRYAAVADDPTREPIADLPGWLTTVTARICLDVLRSARVRREAYVGPWLPEPFVERLPSGSGLTGLAALADAVDPAERIVLTDRISVALLVVLETLGPEQRVAFVLHDVFAVPFDEVAAVLETTPANARQLASRARRAVAAGERRHTTDRAEQERVLTAFLAAVAGGDIDDLIRLLAPDVTVVGDGGGVAPAARTAISGELQVARFLRGLFRRATQTRMALEPVLVNGDLGFLFSAADYGGQDIHGVMAIAVDPAGRITAVFNQLNPTKLTRTPRADPARSISAPQPSPLPPGTTPASPGSGPGAPGGDDPPGRDARRDAPVDNTGPVGGTG